MSRSTLVTAAISVLARAGLTGCSVEAVTATARCAKGLMNYHFGSKGELLAEVAARLAERRVRRRLDALRGTGTAALDALWLVVLDEVTSGEARAWIALMAERPPAPDPAQETQIADAAAVALGLSHGTVPPDALLAGLDGVQLGLVQGRDRVALRDAYDRLWLGLVPA